LTGRERPGTIRRLALEEPARALCRGAREPPLAAAGQGATRGRARSSLTGAASGSRMAVRAAEAGARLSVL